MTIQKFHGLSFLSPAVILNQFEYLLAQHFSFLISDNHTNIILVQISFLLSIFIQVHGQYGELNTFNKY